MIELPVNDEPLQRFSLQEKERRVRRGPLPSLGPVGAIALTRPLVIPLTEALVGEDAELSAFWAGERETHRYDYVTFRCSLEPEAAHPFEKVWIELALSGTDGAEVIAYSMAPRAISDVTQITSGAKLGGAAKLLTAEMSEARTLQRKEMFLQALGEHSPRPYWQFARTEASALAGMFALHLVLRSPRGVAANGTVAARAEISTRTFLIFSSTTAVAGPEPMEFTTATGA